MAKQALEQLEPFESETISDSDLGYGMAGGLLLGAGVLVASLVEQADKAGIISMQPGNIRMPIINPEEPAFYTIAGASAGFIAGSAAAWGIRKVSEKIKYRHKRERWINYHVEMGARQLEGEVTVASFLPKKEG